MPETLAPARSLPLTDLRFLLSKLPVQVPGNLLP